MSGVNMPLADRHRLGAFGESAATAFLIRQGYTIVAQNWRCRYGEVDLIARDGAGFVFVEVRTRRSNGLGHPEESLGSRKRNRMVEVAQAYLATNPAFEQQPWRIDVVVIEMAAGRIVRLEHIQNAIEE